MNLSLNFLHFSQPAGYGTTPGYPQAQPGYPPAAQQGYPPSGSAPYPGAPRQGYPPAGAAPPPAPYPPQQGVPSYQQPVGAPAGAAGTTTLIFRLIINKFVTNIPL